jgi:hypothetical protein
MEFATIDQASEVFLGQWKRLVSTTNWDKGKIIAAWRAALVEADVPPTDYSDEAWSRRVGNVTPQHVGRLRRVWDVFGAVRDTYEGLYWSHFQAALDWSDAEMWLEGAVQNQWSISEMRSQRAEALGLVSGTADIETDAVDAELDEDGADTGGTEVESLQGTIGVVRDAGSDDTDDDFSSAASRDYDDSESEAEDADEYQQATASTAKPIRPFADLPSLPADVSDAFEAYKLCILRHKLGGWEEISRDDLCASLDALKQLAFAPAE